ncbi:hypothetical protein Tco_0263557, partial [Tanacetum coccineum]
DIVPLLPAMLAGAAVDQGEGSAPPAEPHHIHVDPISSTSQQPIPSPPHHSPPHSPFQSPPHSPPHLSPHSPHQSPLFNHLIFHHIGPIKHLSLKVIHQEVLRIIVGSRLTLHNTNQSQIKN